MSTPDQPPQQLPADRDLKFFEREVSPSAYKPAYARGFHTNIPYAAEMLPEIAEIRRERGESVTLPEFSKEVVYYEGRYKLVNKIVNEQHAQGILEIGSGFSPRGLEMTANPEMRYVEIDTPALMAQKRRVVAKLTEQSEIPTRPYFHLQEGSGLDLATLEAADAHLIPGQPIVTEGFVSYLRGEELVNFSKNMHDLLRKHGGGCWIQTVMPIRSKAKRANPEDFVRLYEQQGFTVERRSVSEVKDELISMKQLTPDDSSEVNQLLTTEAMVLVMRVKES